MPGAKSLDYAVAGASPPLADYILLTTLGGPDLLALFDACLNPSSQERLAHDEPASDRSQHSIAPRFPQNFWNGARR
jgi:hypothetical protein